MTAGAAPCVPQTTVQSIPKNNIACVAAPCLYQVCFGRTHRLPAELASHGLQPSGTGSSLLRFMCSTVLCALSVWCVLFVRDTDEGGARPAVTFPALPYPPSSPLPPVSPTPPPLPYLLSPL